MQKKKTNTLVNVIANLKGTISNKNLYKIHGGTGSIGGSTEPLYVIDGVPIDNGTGGAPSIGG